MDAVLDAAAEMDQVPDWRAGLPELLSAIVEASGAAGAWAFEQDPLPGRGWVAIAAAGGGVEDSLSWPDGGRASLAAHADGLGGPAQLCLAPLPYNRDAATGSVLVAPFGANGITTGALVVRSPCSTSRFSGATAHLVALAADAVSGRLHQERLNLGLAVADRAFVSVARAGQALLAAPSWRDALPEFLECLGTASAASRAYLVRVEPERREVREAEWLAPGIAPSLWDDWESALLPEDLGLITRSGGAYQMVASNAVGFERDLWEREGTCSSALVGVMVSGDERYRIGIDDCHCERSWGAIELEALKIGASLLGAAIERGLHDALQREVTEALHARERILTAVARGSESLLRAGDSDLRSVEEVLATIGGAAGGVGGCLLKTVDGGDVFERIAAWGPPTGDAAPASEDTRIVLAPSTLESLQAGIAVRADLASSEFVRTLVPIRSAGGLLGALSILTEVGREWTTGESAALRAAAAMFGAAMERQAHGERLRRHEQQLIETQKLEAVGRLASVVAHDFNNVLTTVGGFAEVLREEVESDCAREYVDSISQASAEAIGLVRQLLAFSRPVTPMPVPLDLARAVHELAPLLRGAAGRHNEVQFLTDPAPVVLDRTEFQQLLLNLVANARDAIGDDGGVVTVETGTLDADSAFVAVSDTGAGVPPAVRDRIFEPFFTTKAPGLGTGLGLATVSRIALAAGGAIDVADRAGGGSRFLARLPLQSADSAAAG